MNLLIIVVFALLVGCTSAPKSTTQANTADSSAVASLSAAVPGPPTMVYKTRADYADYVPILMNDERTEVVSYPDPRDLRKTNGYKEPTLLEQGYLLDNRGINKNVAFLKLTHQDYADLTRRPTLKELNELILDKDPLVELCNCGVRNTFMNVERDVNAMIKAGTLRTKCTVLK